jgi:TPR repeat protein
MFPSKAIPALAFLTISLVVTPTTGCSSGTREVTAQDLIRKGNRCYSGVWVPRDVERAAEYYRKAAEFGDPDAQCLVGRCYDSGIGLPKNDAEATAWYARAAHGGNAEAQYRLGLAYERGTGIGKNLLQAYLWLNRASSSGMEKAASCRDALGCRMTPSEVTKAQQLSLTEEPKK